jgi:hypothetical protein
VVGVGVGEPVRTDLVAGDLAEYAPPGMPGRRVDQHVTHQINVDGGRWKAPQQV